MKKLITLIIVFAFSKTNLNAQLLNGSFENWSTLQYSEPAGWHNGNEESVPVIGSACVTEVAGVNGSAIRLETMVNENDTAQAFFTNGDPMSGEGGIPCASQPTSLTGNIRYNIPGNDTALILVMFKKNGAIVGSNVIQIKGTGIQNSFAPFTYPVTSSVAPDSVIIAATSSNLLGNGGVEVGSFIEIDDLAFAGAAVSIPNGDFESWSTSTVDFISDWTSNGDVQKSMDSYDGNYAIRLTTTDYGNGDIGAGQVSNGYYSQNGPAGGIPFTLTTDTLCGYYKYVTSGSDSAEISASASANNVAIGGGFMKFGPAAQYTYFEIPIYCGSVPDSLQINFSSSYWPYTMNSVGSTLYIDQLALRSQLTAGIAKNDSKNPFSAYVFPNPSSHQISIRTEQALHGKSIVSIYDVTGTLVKSEIISEPGNTIELDITTLNQGTYFFKVICGSIVLQSSFTKN
jgi:hypothetical protein